MKPDRFTDKLSLALKTLVLSRAALAQGLGVDKSLVGRWASGKVTPSEHNFTRLTQFIAERVPGFTLLDWELEPAAFAARLGASDAASPGDGAALGPLLPEAIMDEALHATRSRAAAYEGLWRTTRPSSDLPGRFVHDVTLVQRREDGLIRFAVGVEGVRYEGWSVLLQHQLFSVAADAEASTLMFSIINGVARQRPEVLDGLTLATLRDAGGSPAASACMLERIGDLSGDPDEDEARFDAAVSALSPLAEGGSVPVDVARHLTRDVSDCTPGVLRMMFSRSMARGTLLTPDGVR